MKTINVILVGVTFFMFTSANAQVKKNTVKKKIEIQQKQPVAKTVPATVNSAEQQSSVSLAAVEEKQVNVSTPATPSVKKAVAENQEQPYKVALGVKFLWGISVTGKYFFKKDQALEAIVRYRTYGGVGNDIAITALYEYEKPISDLTGLHWLVGGGAYFGHFSYKNSLYNSVYVYEGSEKSYYGVSAIAGLEYKFNKAPIAISADWMPTFDFNGGGFSSEAGGFGIKYTF